MANLFYTILGKNYDQQLYSDLTTCKGLYGYTILHSHAKNGKFNELKTIFEKVKEKKWNIDIDTKASSNYTALHLAVTFRFEKCVEILLKHNASIESEDSFGKTPIDIAREINCDEILFLLQKEGIKRKVLIYLSHPDDEGRKHTLNEIKKFLKIIEQWTKEHKNICFRECINCIVENCQLSNVNLLTRIAGIIIHSNDGETFRSLIQRCSEKKEHILCWYMLLMRAISKDRLKLFEYLLLKNDHSYLYEDAEFFPVLLFSIIEKARNHFNGSHASQKLSFQYPIRLIVKMQFETSRELQYLQLILPYQQRMNIESIEWVALTLNTIPTQLLINNNRVSKLLLNYNSLRHIPNCVADFNNLTILNVSFNKLTSVSTKILTAGKLEKLNLSNNEISRIEESPKKTEESWLCEKLKCLDLSNNKLRSIEASLQTPYLQELNLSANQFTQLPIFPSSSNSLIKLNLRDNSELNTLPPYIGDKDSLEELHIDYKNFLYLPNVENENAQPQEDIFGNIEEIKNLTRKIKELIRREKPLMAAKMFVIGEDEEQRANFISHLIGSEVSPNINLGRENAMGYTYWASKGQTNADIHIYNVSNNDIPVNGLIMKELCTERTILIILVSENHAHNNLHESTKQWLQEFKYFNPQYYFMNYTKKERNKFSNTGESSCIVVITKAKAQCLGHFNNQAENIVIKIKDNFRKSLFVHEHNIFFDCNIGKLRERVFESEDCLLKKLSGEPNTIGNAGTIPHYLASFEILTLYSTILSIRENYPPKVSTSKLFSILESRPLEWSAEMVKDIKDSQRLKICLRILHYSGLIIYFDLDTSQHIYLSPVILINELAKIVSTTNMSGYLTSHSIKSYITKKLTNNDLPLGNLEYSNYLLLLQKFNLILSCSKDVYIVPLKLPKLRETFKLNEIFKDQDYCHRIITVRNMPRFLCDQLNIDFLYSSPFQFSKVGSSITINDPIANYDQSCFTQEELIFRSSEENHAASKTLKLWQHSLFYEDSENKFKLCIWYSCVIVDEQPKYLEERIEFAMTNRLAAEMLFEVYSLFYSLSDVKSNIYLAGPYIIPPKSPNTYSHINSLERYLYYHSKPFLCTFEEKCISYDVLNKDTVPELYFLENIPGLKFDSIPFSKIKFVQLNQHNSVLRGEFNGTPLAFKKCPNDNSINYFMNYFEMAKEASILSSYKHPCLINLVGMSSIYSRDIFLALEFAPHLSLQSYLRDRSVIKPRILYYRFVQQIACGLHYLHSHRKVPLIHHDVKPENILVFSTDANSIVNLKITDFDLSHRRAIKVRGTCGYMAPEILSKHKIKLGDDEKVDVFSFAMVIYSLLYHKAPYEKMLLADTMFTINQVRPKLNWNYFRKFGLNSLLPIIQTCWDDNPKRRPEMSTVFEAISEPAIQFLYFHRQLPKNASYEPLFACAVTDKLSTFICYGYLTRIRTTEKACNIATKFSLYDVTKREYHEVQTADDYKNKCIRGLCSSSDYVVALLDFNLNNYSKWELIIFEVMANKQLQEKCKTIELKYFQIEYVNCMLIHNNILYLSDKTSIYSCYLEMIDKCELCKVNYIPNGKITSLLPFEKELWVGLEYQWNATSQAQINIFSKKENFVIHFKNKTIGKSEHCQVSEMVFSEKSNQVWCVDSFNPILFICSKNNDPHLLTSINFGKFLPECYSFCDENSVKPSQQKYSYKYTKICAVNDAVWVSTQFGHILVFSTQEMPRILTTLKVFNGQVRCMLPFFMLPERDIQIVATIGQNFTHPFYHLNKNDIEREFYDCLSSNSRGNIELYDTREQLDATLKGLTNRDCRNWNKKDNSEYDKYSLVFWEAYSSEICNLVEKSKTLKYWILKDTYNRSINQETFNLLTLSDKTLQNSAESSIEKDI